MRKNNYARSQETPKTSREVARPSNLEKHRENIGSFPNYRPADTYAELCEFYGTPSETGSGYLATLTLPYPMRLAWDKETSINKISCHKKVVDSLYSCLEDILKFYGTLNEVQNHRLDLYGGCFNYRRMRGGSEWSRHAWGIAIDLDPDQNQLSWGRDRATMPEYIIDIFEKHGWKSYGRTRNCDFMHFQATC